MWLLLTGAKNAMDFNNKPFAANNETYYGNLLKYYDKEFPNPNLHQIQLDLPRTFPEEGIFSLPSNK
jgi:hypothetical protein